MATTLPHIQTHHLPQSYSTPTACRPMPSTTLVPNSSYHVLKAAIKKAIPHSKSSKSTTSSTTTSCSSSISSNTATASIPIPTNTRRQREEHHLRPRSLSFHSPISTSSFSSGLNNADDDIVIEMIEDEEAVADDEDVNVITFGDRKKIERLERARRLLESYGCRGC